MANFSTKDQQLLVEAYSLQLLKESMADMSLNQINSRLHTMTSSELEYIATVNDRILSEAFNFGGLKNLAGSAFQGAKNVGKGVASGVSNAATSAARGVAKGYNTAAQGVKNVGAGVASAAGQVVDNAKDIYNTGQQAGNQEQLLAAAKESIDALTDALRQTDEAGLLGKNRGQFMNLPLKNILAKLEQAQAQSGQNAQTAKDRGFTGGVGAAFSQGRQAGQQAPQPQGGQQMATA